MILKKILILIIFVAGPIMVLAPDNLINSEPFAVVELMRLDRIEKDKKNYQASYQAFKNSLAFFESSNDWKKYNPYGFVGKYQFGKDALDATGFGHVDFIDFIMDPQIFTENDQEKAMDRLLRLNEMVLSPYINEYVGQYILDSLQITRMGLLAAAHLAGPGNVKRFLESEGTES